MCVHACYWYHKANSWKLQCKSIRELGSAFQEAARCLGNSGNSDNSVDLYRRKPATTEIISVTIGISSRIYLKTLIEQLEQLPQDKILPFGFGKPMSYRGYYEELAFEPIQEAKVSDMLDYAKSAMGATFTGYKGGEFTMGEMTDCYIAEYGCSGDKIGPTLINMWRYTLKHY